MVARASPPTSQKSEQRPPLPEGSPLPLPSLASMLVAFVWCWISSLGWPSAGLVRACQNSDLSIWGLSWSLTKSRDAVGDTLQGTVHSGPADGGFGRERVLPDFQKYQRSYKSRCLRILFLTLCPSSVALPDMSAGRLAPGTGPCLLWRSRGW